MRTRKRGFTLLELVVVLAVLGILASVVAPNISKPIGNEQMEAEGNKLAAWLQQTRTLALGLKRCLRVQGYKAGTAKPADSGTFTDATANDLDQLRLLQLGNGDCESASNVGSSTTMASSVSNYSATVQRNFFVPAGYTVRLLPPTANNVPIVWRPSGILRGNMNDDLADDGFDVKIIHNGTGRYLVVRVSTFGQVCTGTIGVASPVC